MEVYVFVYHVKPTKGSPEYGKVGGAHADIWVFESSREAAEIKALSYLMDYAWEVIEVERKLVLDDEQIVQYRPDVQANYHQAKNRGISLFFSGYPPEDLEDGAVEIRPLSKYPANSGSKH